MPSLDLKSVTTYFLFGIIRLLVYNHSNDFLNWLWFSELLCCSKTQYLLSKFTTLCQHFHTHWIVLASLSLEMCKMIGVWEIGCDFLTFQNSLYFKYVSFVSMSLCNLKLNYSHLLHIWLAVHITLSLSLPPPPNGHNTWMLPQ